MSDLAYKWLQINGFALLDVELRQLVIESAKGLLGDKNGS